VEELYLKNGRRAFSRAGFTVLLWLAISTALQYALSLLFSGGMTNAWIRYALTVLPEYLVAMPLAALLLLDAPSSPPAKRKISAGQFAVILTVCIAILYVGNLCGILANMLVELFSHSRMTDLLQELIVSSGILPSIVFVVILAPIAEELFFRRLLIPRLLSFGEKPAVFFSALAFGLIHGNLSQFFYAFGLGLAFGFIFVKTGKIIYCVFIHMIINFYGSVIAVLVLQSSSIIAILVSFVMMGLAITGTTLFFVNLRRISMSRGLFALPNGKRAVYLSPGFVLLFLGCAALFVMTTLKMFSAV